MESKGFKQIQLGKNQHDLAQWSLVHFNQQPEIVTEV